VGERISRDPLGVAGGLNAYEFCFNSPLNYVDPDGEQAIEAFAYWSDVAVSGQDAGGVLGNLQSAGASVMMSFIDFWGARDVEGSAELSGYYSGSDECKGKAWGYGLYAAGMIGINAIPGGGKGTKPIAGKLTGYTEHGLMQVISRDAGRGVHPAAILDAVRNPTKIIKQAGGTTKYVGANGTVVLNQEGKVVTAWGVPRSP
jgi:hypothetical protein